MKVIILAAGSGTRLLPLTTDRPKCMVEYKGRPIIDWILSAVRQCGIREIVVVTGYCGKILESHLAHNGIRFYSNPAHDKTNMVTSLFCAEKEMDDDLVVSYSDIIYDQEALKVLMETPHPFAITIDPNWRVLWEKRMADPLLDAETLKLDREGYVTELGKKTRSYRDIEGQYMGLIRMDKPVCRQLADLYHEMDQNALYDGKKRDQMYMTSFLQHAINRGIKLSGIPVQSPWLEIDSRGDLSIDIPTHV